MKKKTSRIIGIIMLVVAIAFFVFALGHPEMGFPWSSAMTYIIYTTYLIIVAVLFILPFRQK